MPSTKLPDRPFGEITLRDRDTALLRGFSTRRTVCCYGYVPSMSDLHGTGLTPSRSALGIPAVPSRRSHEQSQDPQNTGSNDVPRCLNRVERPLSAYGRAMSKRKYRRLTTAFAACATVMLSACGANGHPRPADVFPTVLPQQRPAPTWNPGLGWTLTWSDDFNRSDSLRGWTLDSGGGGWGNQQLQDYSPKNVALQPGGGLAITADSNGYGAQCWYGLCKYSSGLLKTKGLFQQQYGIFSACIRLPTEPGLWPAFWLEGIDASEVPWPRGGEIDVIEVNNQKSGLVEAFVHSPQVSRGVYKQLPTSLSAGYHIYSVEWAPQEITWLIDGHPYGQVKTNSASPFNQPFFLILDLAVGGDWPGSPTASTTFPAQMNVLWVRAYQQKTKP